MNFRKFDIDSWERKEHYRYYTEILKVEVNITANVTVDKFLDFCHQNGYRFYPALISITTQIVNSLDYFRMFRDKDGNLNVWNYVVPNYTFFHEDDHTFSDLWSDYDENIHGMYKNIICDMEKYKAVKGIKARPDQPGNFYCISCAPWVNFTSLSSRITNGEPQFFPVITAGKYHEECGKTVMPVNLIIAHAVCDGYHVSQFYSILQNALDNPEKYF